ncbi:TPA: hypothetical protein ACNV27_004295 [Citrobacter gillenii]
MEKLLSREISQWNADRKFNFAEIVNFQAPHPPANIRPQRIKQAGGAAKILPPQRAKRHAHVPFFCGGLAPHTVKPGNISRPSGDITDQARPTPLKQRSRFLELARKNRQNSRLKGVGRA